jgi:heterodisulfide reductase subunit C
MMKPLVIKNQVDPDFVKNIAAKIGLDEIKPCYSCGSCTGVCPVRKVLEDFDPRRMIHMILLGMKQELLSSDLIWLCCRCNSCYSVCPQGIRFSRIAKELQGLARSEGFVHSGFTTETELLNDYLEDLCRRTMFEKVKQGFQGPHTMPCWRKNTSRKR